MIDRYTLISSIYGPMMDNSRKGKWVKFEDYERLRQDHLQLNAESKELGRYLAFRTVADHYKFKEEKRNV